MTQSPNPDQFTPSRATRAGAEPPAPGGPLAFTPTRQIRFCEDLSGHGNVRLACARAGIAPQTVYRFRRRDLAFARCWDAAQALARVHVEAVLADRALEGVEEAVYYHGQEIARRRRYDSRLLLAHLGRLDARCAAARAQCEGPEDFDALLAGLAGEGAGPTGMGPGGMELGAREEHVAACGTLAEYALEDALRAELAESGEEWGEAETDALIDAEAEARLFAGEEWDAARAAMLARVDAVVAGEESEPEPERRAYDDAVPTDLPYEIKSAIPQAVFALQDTVTCVTPSASRRLRERGEGSRRGRGGSGDRRDLRGRRKAAFAAQPPCGFEVPAGLNGSEKEGGPAAGCTSPRPLLPLPSLRETASALPISALSEGSLRSPTAALLEGSPRCPIAALLEGGIHSPACALGAPDYGADKINQGEFAMRRFNTVKAVAATVIGLGMVSGVLGASGIALAQGGPPPGFVPPPPVAAPLWALDVPFVNTKPILFADLAAGSPDSFTGVIDPATNQLCYIINAPGLDAPTMAHIHKGGPGESGAPVVALANPAGGASGGCVSVKPDVAQALVANPGGYYVNVHTAALPDGFERGQLQTKSKAAK